MPRVESLTACFTPALTDNLLLKGVMRFLQTEWHRHERDRNAWQIERAEMKSRIGKLEGDGRTNKRLRESMDKHIRILEHALKKEREKMKALQNEGQTGDQKEEKNDIKQDAKADTKRRCTGGLKLFPLSLTN